MRNADFEKMQDHDGHHPNPTTVVIPAAPLLLPMVALQEAETGFAAVLIPSLLQKMQLDNAHIQPVTNMILEGLKP